MVADLFVHFDEPFLFPNKLNIRFRVHALTQKGEFVVLQLYTLKFFLSTFFVEDVIDNILINFSLDKVCTKNDFFLNPFCLFDAKWPSVFLEITLEQLEISLSLNKSFFFEKFQLLVKFGDGETFWEEWVDATNFKVLNWNLDFSRFICKPWRPEFLAFVEGVYKLGFACHTALGFAMVYYSCIIYFIYQTKVCKRISKFKINRFIYVICF